jgi:hypothetical protein
MSEEFKFNCEKCKYKTNKQGNYSRHLKTKKHKKNYEKEIEKQEKENKKMKYSCELCNYYTNNISGFSHHKRTKKHKKQEELNKKIYNCDKCDKCSTNDQFEFMKHFKEKHMDFEKDIQKLIQNNTVNNNSNNNNCNNKIQNNNIHIHINTDKETYGKMLKGMDNKSFLELLGGVDNMLEYNKNKLWDENNIEKNFLSGLMDKTIENKIENKSIEDVKITDSDYRKNIIQVKDKDKGIYNSCDSKYLLGNILENNIELMKAEHIDRIIKNEEYRKFMMIMDLFGNKIDFKKGYEYNFNVIINDIIEYSKESINLIKNNKKSESNMEERIRNFKYMTECFRELQKKINIINK